MKFTKQLEKKLKHRLRLSRLRKGFKLSGSFDGEYLVTSELGVIHISGNRGRLLTSRPGYGIAVDGKVVYLSYENLGLVAHEEMSSFVTRVDLDDLLNGGYFDQKALMNREVLYRQPFPSPNGRIHQLAYCTRERRLLIASSQSNAIVSIEESGERKILYPFLDKFGVPIRFDHNHINSVLPVKGALYFVSYNAGGKSMIGCIRDGESLGWHVGPVGFHDIFPTASGFISCDTFGDLEHGRVLTESGELLEQYFLESGRAPRGAAGTVSEVLIGHSHKGPRSKRFKGFGGVIRVDDMERPEYIELPVAQVYQIIRLDGVHFVSNETVAHEDFETLLTRRFGEPFSIGPYVEETL